MLEAGDAHMQDHAYFASIDEEMNSGGREALLYYLLNFDLSKVNLRSVPKTLALLKQKIFTATPEQAWWLDTLMNGRLPKRIGQDNGTCLKDDVFASYIEHARRRGVSHRSIEVLIGIFLTKHIKGLKSAKVEYGDTRVPVYEFPPLTKCRAQFAECLRPGGQMVRGY
jgi:hypothetical protein